MTRGAVVATVLAVAATMAVAVLAFRAHEFAESALDHRPFPLRAIDLQAPPSRGGVEYYGKLRMLVHIGADGVVKRVEVMESTLPGSFEQAASTAFGDARWEPGRKWGLAVGAVKPVEVDFAPPSGDLRGAISSPGR